MAVSLPHLPFVAFPEVLLAWWWYASYARHLLLFINKVAKHSGLPFLRFGQAPGHTQNKRSLSRHMVTASLPLQPPWWHVGGLIPTEASFQTNLQDVGVLHRGEQRCRAEAESHASIQ